MTSFLSFIYLIWCDARVFYFWFQFVFTLLILVDQTFGKGSWKWQLLLHLDSPSESQAASNFLGFSGPELEAAQIPEIGFVLQLSVWAKQTMSQHQSLIVLHAHGIRIICDITLQRLQAQKVQVHFWGIAFNGSASSVLIWRWWNASLETSI